MLHDAPRRIPFRTIKMHPPVRAELVLPTRAAFRRSGRGGRMMAMRRLRLQPVESPQAMDGLLSKIRKIHKKTVGKLEKKVVKKLPKALRKPLQKIEAKREGIEDKVMNNKTLNKVVDVAAVAVGSYFYPPLATMAKSMLTSEVTKRAGAKYASKQQKKAEKKALRQAAAEQARLVDEALADVPTATKERIKALVAKAGPDVLNSPEVRAMLAESVGTVAAQTASKVSEIQGGGAPTQDTYAQAANVLAQEKVLTGETSTATGEPVDGLPGWVLPVGIGAVALILLMRK